MTVPDTRPVSCRKAMEKEKGTGRQSKKPVRPPENWLVLDGALLPQARCQCQSHQPVEGNCHSAAILSSVAVNCAASVESAIAVVADCPPLTATEMASNQPAPTSRWWRVAV